MQKHLLLYAAVAALSLGTVGANAATNNFSAASSFSNLAVNGTFMAYNTGFTSQYNYADPAWPNYDQIPETQYEITDNSIKVRPNGNWGSFVGPVSGENFLVINGATSLNPDSSYRNFWEESINLNANSTYKLTADIASLYWANPAAVAMTVNGSLTGGSFLADKVSGAWSTESFLYHTGATSGPLVLGLADVNTIAFGNDFAVTNMSVSAIPEPATWAMLVMGFCGLGALLRTSRGRRATVSRSA
jgi:hypothetical protein